MTENTKKWLTVAGCLVVCAILVAVIASSFSKDKVTDDLLPPSSSQQGDVVVDPDSSTPPPAESARPCKASHFCAEHTAALFSHSFRRVPCSFPSAVNLTMIVPKIGRFVATCPEKIQ